MAAIGKVTVEVEMGPILQSIIDRIKKLEEAEGKRHCNNTGGTSLESKPFPFGSLSMRTRKNLMRGLAEMGVDGCQVTPEFAAKTYRVMATFGDMLRVGRFRISQFKLIGKSSLKEIDEIMRANAAEGWLTSG